MGQGRNQMDELLFCDYLDRIVGQPIDYIGRVIDLLNIGIGDSMEVLDRNGRTVKKSTYSLHIQSAWRIVNPRRKEILLVYSDIYSPREGIEDDQNFNWRVKGDKLFDQKTENYLKKTAPIYIESYEVNIWGDLLLVFSNGDRLEVFVDVSDDSECWRIFKSECEEPHLVLTGHGIVLG